MYGADQTSIPDLFKKHFNHSLNISLVWFDFEGKQIEEKRSQRLKIIKDIILTIIIGTFIQLSLIVPVRATTITVLYSKDDIFC